MKKSTTLLALCLIAGAAAIALSAVASNTPSAFVVKPTECEHSGNHYEEVAPTGSSVGAKEYWVCCDCHKHFLTEPASGTWASATHTAETLAGISNDDDRYLPSLAPFARVDQSSNVTVTKNEDGTWTYSNKTSGVLAGNAQNWGESGAFFMDATGTSYSILSAAGYKYLKFDVNFDSSVTSWNLRFGEGIRDYYINEIGFDKELPNGREVNLFDMAGKRVSQISHNVWYTLYVKVIGNNINSFFTNGGSAETPATVKIRNVTMSKEINPSVAPYYKDDGGSISVATEEGFEGCFKATNGTKNLLAFRGITHTSSPDGVEYAGGFFDSNDTKYFLFDYYISSDNYAFNFEAKGTGFSPSISIYCDKNATGAGATIYCDGAKVEKLVDGWCTIQLEVPHTAGGWTDFVMNVGGSTTYLKNLYYSKTAVLK